MKENFTATQKEVVARKMGYNGPMQMFDEFLMSRPSDAQRYASITSKFAENMAKGGMVGYKNLASKGRNGDTMLAHINPEEAALLKARGGSGTINPKTGLPEFYYAYNSPYGLGFPQRELEPLPVLAQAFALDEFKYVPDKLNKTTVPQEGFGKGIRPAYEKISDNYLQYADRSPASGMGGGRQIEGYSIPTEQTFQGKPLEAKYDSKGNFIHFQLAGGNLLYPDPNQPNIAASPKFNKTGGIVDYGVFDLNNQDDGGFGSFVSGFIEDFGPMIALAVGANYLAGSGLLSAGGATAADIAASNALAQANLTGYAGTAFSAIPTGVGIVASGSPLTGFGTGATSAATTTAAELATAADIAGAASAPGLGIKAATGTGLDLASTIGTTVGDAGIKAGIGSSLDTVGTLAATTGGGAGITAGSAGANTIGAGLGTELAGITTGIASGAGGSTLLDAAKAAKNIVDASKEGEKENKPKNVSGAIGLLIDLLGERNKSTRGQRNYADGGYVTLTPDIARSLMDRTTTVGVSNAELDKYGGYDAVKAMFNANEGSSTSSTGGSPTASTAGNPALGTQPTAATSPPKTTTFTDAMKATATQPAALKTASAQPDVAAETATAATKAVADTITVDKAQTALTTAVEGVSAQTGSVSEGAKAAAATVTPTTTDVGKDAAATGTATAVAEPTARVLQTGEQVSGSAVDQEQVKQALAKTEAAQGTVTEDMTTQGQLNKLLKNFDAGNPPPWAAASMRSVTAQLAARGLGASSIAGQAIVQATLEAALPIAATDAKVFEQMGLQNLSNKQQTAMILGEQRAKFLGQEFDQSFQAKVLNAARIADIADKNFTADVTIALENARITSTMDLQNLSNDQALILAKTAQVANLETANLSNKQQVAVENAKAFLTLDVKNLDNKQQVALFKGKAIADSILTDTAASNAIKATNASNALDASKVNAQLAFSASQFNAAEKNKVAMFNKSAAEEISKFNAQQENQRSEFNANLSTQISVANAKLLADVSMANTRETNAMAAVNAKNATDLSASTYAQLSQTYRDQLETTWKTSENVLDRANDIAKVTLTTEATKYAGDAAADASYYAALGSLSASMLNSAGGSKVVGSLIDKGVDTVLGWFGLD